MNINEIPYGRFARLKLCDEEHDCYFYPTGDDRMPAFVSITDPETEGFGGEGFHFHCLHGKEVDNFNIEILTVYSEGVLIQT